MEMAHGEFTGPGVGGGRQLHNQHIPQQLQHPEHLKYPLQPSQAPAWLCACIHQKRSREITTSAHVLGSTVLTRRSRGGLLLRLKTAVRHPCSPESEGSLWVCWSLISFPTTQQLSQSSLAGGLRFGSKLFAPHLASFLKMHVLIEEVYKKNHEISWTTEKFKSRLFWKIRERLMAT